MLNETIYKGEPIPKNRYILVVLVFIQNSKGKLLIQKRSINKDGKFGTTGGHPKSGESSIEGIRTEIKEELGLNIPQDELKLVYNGKSKSKQVFFDVYYLNKDINIETLNLQKEEVEYVKWLSINEINELINSDLFLENHVEEFYRLIDIFKERGNNIA